MRLWLDNHISPHVARALRERGFDVVALQEEPRPIQELSDEGLLAEAAERGRMVVTYNARDFLPLHLRWLATGRSHPGVILIADRAIRQQDIGSQVLALTALLDAHGNRADLQDQVVWLKPAP